MPHQSFRFENMDSPFRGGQIAACADFSVPQTPTSQRKPWLGTRFGFLGSSEGFDLMRFEATTLALTRCIASTVLAAGQIDVLVIECAEDDLTEDWGLSFLDWAGAEAPVHDLMLQAEEAGIPRIALLRGDSGHVPLFTPLATAADYVVVTSAAAHKALERLGIAADLVAPTMQPAFYHGFVSRQDEEAWKAPQVLSLDLVRAIDEPEIAALLDSLTPFDFGLCTADRVVSRRREEALPAILAQSSLGTVTADQLHHLFGRADLLVQLAKPDRAPGRDIQHALHAAASRCAVAILGEVPDDDPRLGFAKVFSDIRELRFFVSRLTMDPVFAQMHLQSTWRRVHRDHAAATLAQRLAAYATPDTAGKAHPRATVVTPTFRPERLQEALETFRAQTWPHRELIVVANTDDPAQWDSTLLRPNAGEQIVFLPRRFGPGTALNIGGARGSGDYVLRMDDDDHYGRHYVEDMMLGAAAVGADMMGKSACFYYYVDEDRLVYLPHFLQAPKLYPSAQIGNGGHLAGFSHTVRRSLLLQLGGFPDGQHGGVDVGFLSKLIDNGELLCARADALNAVVERRSDVRSHTWQTAHGSDNVHFKEVRVTLQTLLDDGEASDASTTVTRSKRVPCEALQNGL